MDEKEWDKEFSQKITELTGEIWTGRYDLKGLQTLENKIFAVIRKDREHQSIDKLSVGRLPPKLDKLVSNLIRLDRKHQKSETLKRLPSIGDMYNCFEVIWKRRCKIFRKGTNRENNVDYSYAVAQEIHRLAEDKLK